MTNETQQITPSRQPSHPAQAAPVYVVPRRSFGRRFIGGLVVLLLIVSLVLNGYLGALLAMHLQSPVQKNVLRDGAEGQTIALCEINGIIDGDTAAWFDTFYRTVADDRNVKAVLIRVESPGGGVTPSDQIAERIRRLREKGKKVVVSMGSLAASGGYYVSAGADEIFAEETTLTGSIGVILQWPVFKGTLDKIGVEMITLKSAHSREWKDELSPFRKPEPQEREHLIGLLNEVQNRFEQVVLRGRGSKLKAHEAPKDEKPDKDRLEYEAFNGKVYMAEKAMKLGLVDTIGYQANALDRAAGMAALDNPRVVRYSRREGLFEQMMGSRPPAGVSVDVETLDRLQTPRMLLMWKAE